MSKEYKQKNCPIEKSFFLQFVETISIYTMLYNRLATCTFIFRSAFLTWLRKQILSEYLVLPGHPPILSSPNHSSDKYYHDSFTSNLQTPMSRNKMAFQVLLRFLNGETFLTLHFVRKTS